MRIVQRKLDFLVLYVAVSLAAIGIVRRVLVQLAEWLQQVPAAVTAPEHY